MASLQAEGFRALLSELPEDEAEAVLRQLMAENVDNLAEFEEFTRLLVEERADLSRIAGVNHRAVSIDTFIDHPYFLNQGEFVYPEVRKAIKEVINGGYIQFLAMGAIGRGKTTAAQIVTAYHIYLLSLEKHPQIRFGLFPTSTIYFAMLNKDATLAKDVTYAGFYDMVEPVAYFNEHFPFDRSAKTRMIFPNHIHVISAAAYNNKLLGRNVVGGILDELNFMARIKNSKRSDTGGEFDQAKKIHGAMVRRRKSRFLKGGKLPGCICVVSSAGYPGDFTDELKAKIEADKDGLTYVWDGPQWEVVPQSRFTGEKFALEIGDSQFQARVLKDAAEARKGAEVIMVPVEYRQDFLDNINDAMRDIVGRNVATDRPYFWDKAKVWGMAVRNREMGFLNPFAVESVDLTKGLPALNEDCDSVPYPQRDRAMHIDLATGANGGDAAGISMGYVYKTSHNKSRFADQVHARGDGEPTHTVEEVPMVRFDFNLQVVAPRGGEIEFSLIREFIYYVRDVLGYPLKYVTFDGFQSVDSRQILKNAGFLSGLVSVEGTESYEALRTAIWQERVDCPEHKIAFDELCSLEENRKDKKIDHRPDGSKDVSDSMAGVYKTLVTRRESWKPAPMQGPQPVYDTDGALIGAKPIPAGRRNVSRRNVTRK